MAVQIAPNIPYRPALCSDCTHYAGNIRRCRAYVTDSTPRPLLGVFSGESSESCPRFSLLQTTGSVTSAPGVPPAVNPAPAESFAPEPRIFCPKCRSDNSPYLIRCADCGTNLLPGESLAFRLAVFILCLLLSGLFGWLGYAIYNQTIHLPESLNDPLKALFIAVILPFAGLVTLFRRTPRFTRFANRAERHVPLNLRQAAADYTEALEHAPEKEHANLLRKRAAVYEKLGQSEDANRDLIAVTYADGAYQGGAAIAGLFGADGDKYALSRAKDERTNLVNSGRAVMVGYCPACKDAVLLDSELRCPAHPRSKPKRVRMVVPGDVAEARKEIVAGKKRGSPASRKDRTLRFAILLVALATGYLLLKAYVLNPREDAQEAATSQPALVEVSPTAAVELVVSDDQGVNLGEQVVETLAPAMVETAAPSDISGQVRGNSINVRAGPGTSYAVVGRLPANSEIQVAGRNEAGDWLNLSDPPGWVSADLVTVPTAIDALPVVGK